MTNSRIFPAGTIFEKRYKILKLLGSGGTAQVYQVFDKEKDQVRALKLLLQTGNQSYLIPRLQREFVTLFKIKHPNIVSVYDYGSTGESDYYFTMDYIAGPHLGSVPDHRDIQTFPEILVTILQTLQFIHSKGLVHGDIKPQNFIISSESNDVVLTDFGMVADISLTPTGPIQGTLNFMSPEIIQGYAIDQRADIYSLGVLVYGLLSGKLPFDAADPITILRQHLTKKPPHLGTLNEKCPEYLSALVMKCLEKRPLDRFQSADEIIKEIARHNPGLVSDESITLRESYILTSEFVGRKKELDYLISNLELSLGGKGQTVFIGGESGVGKSRLVDEFRIRCQLEGYTVLQAQCFEKESRPNQTVVQLCQQLLLSVSDKQRQVVERYAVDLEKLSPDFKLFETLKTSRQAQSIMDPTIERTLFYDALTQLFIDISKSTPLIFILEDIHWGDQVTIGILQYLIRNLGKANIMICGTYLKVVLYSTSLMGQKAQLETLIEENSPNPNFHDILLESFKPGDLASLIGSMLGMAFKPEEFGRALYEETGGNPFIVTEFMKQLVKENVIFRERGEWIVDVDDISMLSIPSSVREIYQRRLELLSPQALQLLDLFAIPQKGIDLSTLLLISSLSEEELFEKLYELLNVEVIEQKGDVFRCVNPRIKEIIYESISLNQKIELHSEFGRLLEEKYVDPEEVVNELAFHFVKGNQRLKALKYSVMAAEISERVFAHEQAAEHYSRALNLAAKEDILSRSKYMRKLVDLHMMIGNYALALEQLEHIFVLARENEIFTSEEICVLNRKTAGIYEKMGEYHRALKYLYDGLALMKDDTTNFATAQIHTNLGNIYMFLGDTDKALAHCHLSLEIVEPQGNLRELSEIYNTFGKIYVHQRSQEKALTYFTKSLQLREKIGDTLGIGRTYSNLGVISVEIGDAQQAEDYYLSGLKIFEKIGFIYGSASIYNNLGILYYYHRTDWEQGISYLMKARELHERTGNDFGVAMSCGNLAFIFSDLGDLERAREYLERALIIYKKLENMTMILRLELTKVSLLLDENELDTAYENLSTCRQYIETHAGNEELMVSIWHELGRYYLLKNDLDQSLDCCHRGFLLARKYGQRENEGLIRLLEADIYKENKDYHAQEKALLESNKIMNEEGVLFLSAKVFWELGQFYHGQNQDQKALEYIEKARDIFQKIGVRSYYEVAQDLLAKMRERVLPNLFKFQGDQSDIATLYKVSHDIISTLDLPNLLEKILDAAIKTVKAERGLLILYDEHRKDYEVKVARNMDRKTQDDMATVSGGVVERSVGQGIPIISTDASIDPRFKDNKSVIIFNIKSILCVPLKIKEKIIGALYVDNRALTNQFTEKDLDFLVVLANQAAISIDNAILYERYRSATNNLNVGMIVMEKNGHIINCNSKASEILNIAISDLIGHQIQRDEESLFPLALADTLLLSMETGEMIEKELRIQLALKDYRIVDLSTTFIYDGFGESIGLLCIFRDITAYKVMQEELELQKRMTAIGDLAAKIAHRMKSYLAGVKILAQEMKKQTPDDELKSEYLAEIMLEVAEAERYVLNELSPQKISVAGLDKVDITTILNQILISTQKECRRKGIDTLIELSDDLPKIVGDPVQLKEVFNNLIINAIQAVRQNGKVKIRSVVTNGYIEVYIQDNGIGIPEKIKEKIFEPFYTTREDGSGVGLWIVHSIVSNLGGKIVVNSQPDEGTVFCVRFPVQRAEPLN
ncbi:tetratricopeptide repeat protein [candidate division CSSED10-310 bacterium]|uniref:histidine kinase n=1 Tax=candidate division CSSED10-310 bacterium TaxID=2855610 RepID=A0ABV6YXW9_UNCC1